MQHLPHFQGEKAKIHSVCKSAAEVLTGWSLSSLCSCSALATKSNNAQSMRLESQVPSTETRGKGDALVSMSPHKVLSRADLKHHEALLIVYKNCTFCLICNGSLSLMHYMQNTPSILKTVIFIRDYWDTRKKNKLEFFKKVWQLKYYVKAPDF